MQDPLVELSRYFCLWVDDWDRFVIVREVTLPPGFNRRSTDVLIELPEDYPMSPPGVAGSRIYVNAGLTFHRRIPAEYRECSSPTYGTPGFGPWAWICYEHIHWNPVRDNLVRFVEMLRADLTQPPTIQKP
ncbi:MAG: hypothetical protein A2V70_16655 [Planctomycetes bacterium RBG_13_63_9]|nr:MAG: hypothetical protein A2V70_16655 [Planctomycetes bacterium RBG_13_63_9]